MILLPGNDSSGQLEVREEYGYRACNAAIKEGWDLYAVVPARASGYGVIYILVRYNIAKINNTDVGVYDVIER